MRSKRIPAKEQYRLIMECRQSGLTDHQWCVEHDIKPGTFYNWVKRLRQKGCVDLPASTGRSYRAPPCKCWVFCFFFIAFYGIIRAVKKEQKTYGR